MHRIIKMEEEDYPLHEHYDPALLNHCMTTFHDQDSNQQIIHAKCSTNDVIAYLTQTIDLCDTPLNDILNFVQTHEIFKGVDIQIVKRKVIKQKNILKRNRAKNRKYVQKAVATEINASIFSGQPNEEYKKQRNRISAQISRDRKKEKVKELEDKNRLLKEQFEKIKAENQKLKEQLGSQQTQRFIPTEPYNNKLTKLLIILGLIFLFGIIKDFFLPQNKKVEEKFQIKNFDDEYSSQTSEQLALDFTEDEKNAVSQNLEPQLCKLFQNTSFGNMIKDKIVHRGLKWHKSWTSIFTSRGRQELAISKELALSL